MRSNFRSLGLITCMLFFGSAPAMAQPIFGGAESVELTVARSRVVVVGKIIEVSDDLPDGPGDERLATILVEETLKGKHQARQVALSRYPRSQLTEWEGQSTRLLVGLDSGPQIQTRFVDLTPNKVEVLTADATLLRTPEEVLKIARETVLRLPGTARIKEFRYDVPSTPYAGTHWEGFYAITVSIPVDDRLQQQALKWIQSKEYGRKEDGAKALRYFKTDENIKHITALLDDPSWGYLKHPDQNNGIEVRHYGVRKAAYATLTYWGVKVKKPQFREEIRVPPK